VEAAICALYFSPSQGVNSDIGLAPDHENARKRGHSIAINNLLHFNGPNFFLHTWLTVYEHIVYISMFIQTDTISKKAVCRKK
jgi:hypothetical protein